jgi:hypothetical protein
VELFEQIRREYDHWGRSDSCGGEETGCPSADGATGAGERRAAGKETTGTRAATAGSGQGIYKRHLEADRQAPGKQRHTAHRIYVRIRRERPEVQILETTVPRYVG